MVTHGYSYLSTDKHITGTRPPGYRGGGDVQGDKSVEGKLRRVWCDSGGVILEGSYGEATC